MCRAFHSSFGAMLSANFHEKLSPTKACAACGHQAANQQQERGHWPDISRHFQAYFQLTDRKPEQNPSWYLPATTPRQCQAGTGHRNLLLPPRAATTNQQGPQFWAPAQIPVLAQLQFPSLISCLRSLGQTMEAGT